MGRWHVLYALLLQGCSTKQHSRSSVPGRAGEGTSFSVQWLFADVERSQSCYNILSHGREMRNILKQDGGTELTSHITGEKASLLHWAMMAYPTWNKKGSDSGAPYAGPCVTQDKVRSASAPSPQQGRAVSQHPFDCEIWGSLQAGEPEQEAKSPQEQHWHAGAVDRVARLPSLCPETGEPQFPAPLLAGDSCSDSFNRAGKPPAWSPPPAHLSATTRPLALGRARGQRTWTQRTWIPHCGVAATTSAPQPGHWEHGWVPSWGRQCNHQQKGNAFHQHHNGPHRHHQLWVLKKSRGTKIWDKKPKTKPKRCRVVSTDLKFHSCGLYRA